MAVPKRSLFIFSCILLALMFSSCTCIYFNTFHNIRKNFNTAEGTRNKDGRDVAKGAEVKQYTDAITKASRVLERHPTSSWVDDALYIIGASYYYLEEYDKSARKFKELFANYPQSEYIDRSRLLLAKAKLQLKEEAEAVVIFEEIFTKDSEKKRKAEAARSLGTYYFENKEYDKANDYFMSLIDSLGDEQDKLRAYMFMADGNFDLFNFKLAHDDYMKALENSPDTLQSYKINYRAAECEFYLGKLSDGLDRLYEMEGVDAYYDSLPAIHLKLAEGYEWDGDLASAIEAYKEVAVEAAGRDPAAVAYYELALIYQYELEDLKKAREYYEKARDESRNSSVREDALKRASKLALLEEYSQITSIDLEDSTQHVEPYEIEALSKNQYLLGELFYFDLEKVDSAAQAFEIVLDRFPQSMYAPKALMSLAYIYSNNYDDSTAAKSYLRRVLKEYAHYDEAETVINQLGLAGTLADSGYAAIPFRKAEKFLDRFQASDAILYHSRLLTEEQLQEYAKEELQRIADSTAVLELEEEKEGATVDSTGSAFEPIEGVDEQKPDSGKAPPPDTLLPPPVSDAVEAAKADTAVALADSAGTDSTESGADTSLVQGDTAATTPDTSNLPRLNELMAQSRLHKNETPRRQSGGAADTTAMPPDSGAVQDSIIQEMKGSSIAEMVGGMARPESAAVSDTAAVGADSAMFDSAAKAAVLNDSIPGQQSETSGGTPPLELSALDTTVAAATDTTDTIAADSIAGPPTVPGDSTMGPPAPLVESDSLMGPPAPTVQSDSIMGPPAPLPAADSTVPGGAAATQGGAATDSSGAPELVAEYQRTSMEILDSLWTTTERQIRGKGFDRELMLLDSSYYYYRYVIDSFPHSKYNLQARYVLLWTYDNFLSGGDSSMVDLYKSFVDSFPNSEYAELIGSDFDIYPSQEARARAKEKERFAQAQEDEEKQASDSAGVTDSTGAEGQPVDSTENQGSDRDPYTFDEDGNPLPPADRFFQAEGKAFEYPLEALQYKIEGKYYFHVVISFTGEVKQVIMINETQSQEFNDRLIEVVEYTRFDSGQIPPELFDHWFYYTKTIQIPEHLRQ